MFYDFNGNGVQEAFALVDVGGRKESGTMERILLPMQLRFSQSLMLHHAVLMLLQTAQHSLFLSVTTSTGESYSCIYGADGANGYMVADLLPGVFVSDGVSLQLDNGMNGVAYLLASDGAIVSMQHRNWQRVSLMRCRVQRISGHR